MKLTFAKFERATILLENTIDSIDDKTLLENGFTREELIQVNEGLLGDIFGGIFGKIKEKILKNIPGSVLKKVDTILKDYKTTKLSISDKTQKERDKIYKANFEDKEDPRMKEQIKRSEIAIAAIEAASKAKLDSISKQLDIIKKDKSEIVKNYIEMQLLQIQEDVANQQLKAAEKNASEEELDRLEAEIKDFKTKKAAVLKAIEDNKAKEEASKKQSETDKAKNKEKKDAEEADKTSKSKEAADKIANDPANAKVGQKWNTKNGNTVEILHLTKQVDKDGNEKSDLDKDSIYIKGESGTPGAIKRDKLKSLAK